MFKSERVPRTQKCYQCRKVYADIMCVHCWRIYCDACWDLHSEYLLLEALAGEDNG